MKVTDVENYTVASVAITNLDDESRIAFESHRFVDAKDTGFGLKVEMMHVYIGILVSSARWPR